MSLVASPVETLAEILANALTASQIARLKRHACAQPGVCTGELAYWFVHWPTQSAALDVLACEDVVPFHAFVRYTSEPDIPQTWRQTYQRLCHESGRLHEPYFTPALGDPLSLYMETMMALSEKKIWEGVSLL